MGREPRITVSDVAIRIYTTALHFIMQVTSTPQEQAKEAAKIYAANQVDAIITALYECSQIDKFTPHDSIAFYNDVRKKISGL